MTAERPLSDAFLNTIRDAPEPSDTREFAHWCCKQLLVAEIDRLKAGLEDILDELSDKACPKCGGENGIFTKGGEWVQCPRCCGECVPVTRKEECTK